MAALLSSAEVASYKQQGYFLYHNQLFAPEKLAQLTAIFEEHLANKGTKRADELDTPHFEDPRLLDFLLSDEPLNLIEPLIGPNIGLWSSHFICKEPYSGRATPWHEDSAYWNGRLDRYDGIVTIWLALDRSTKENGCMRVIPSSHTNGFSEYSHVDGDENTFDTEITNVDEDKAVYFELERGECSLHDSRIIHGATANKSPYRRCGYTMRYFSTEAKINTTRKASHKIWLARGKDLVGNTYVNA